MDKMFTLSSIYQSVCAFMISMHDVCNNCSILSRIVDYAVLCGFTQSLTIAQRGKFLCGRGILLYQIIRPLILLSECNVDVQLLQGMSLLAAQIVKVQWIELYDQDYGRWHCKDVSVEVVNYTELLGESCLI